MALARPEVPSAAIGGNVGIGLRLDSKLQVQEIVAGGPCAACGVIGVGDVLVTVDGRDVQGKKVQEISHLIVGPQGSEVEIVVLKVKTGIRVPVKLLRGTVAQAGVGIKLQRNEDGEITVQDLHPQGSAARAGLKASDIIEKVGDLNVMGRTVRDIAPMFAGPENSSIQVTVLRGPQKTRMEFTLKRMKIESGPAPQSVAPPKLAAMAPSNSHAAEEAKKKAEEEAKKRAEEEAKKKAEEARNAEEEAKKKAEEEAKKKAEEEAKKKAEEEAARNSEEEAKKKAEEEAKKKAEEEAKKKAEEEAKKKAEEEAKKKAEEEAKKKAEEARNAEEKAKKKAEEEGAKKKVAAEEEATKAAVPSDEAKNFSALEGGTGTAQERTLGSSDGPAEDVGSVGGNCEESDGVMCQEEEGEGGAGETASCELRGGWWGWR
ncbi:hypothetical protein GUITHDRAFT_165989 [Guillardia theta CCMP2712]|uniref:PDZ domain-containing protein n=2 Tax=Guillardia theta TaxID=55529 RepID=L1IHY9_GUITC|nr:hypothetical protein GUITHDRAFT_165989 [Guillardia theta CCMP2712]EKX35425.1 hypothetical protein GUITHDRAFT_165989 [Guillardia theta CCMP2712]|eukprot:XP_005822405.1 hypothetical protein GUITHDRAFT_165989 [Guillardia theta CCMP2712]